MSSARQHQTSEETGRLDEEEEMKESERQTEA